ncbi:hypothetical protein BT96DRAFT_944488 [Gymnopus androsaceus JB14]|uniref:Uncharacterized protein n=1 Tax=Gymnopus androsaceus JB14 TaxID=1447944 RepID=A0A6A4H3C6_9AGAR|nr:hypothetical protein BT96DRAFT_944488 [Gymnopus androsaceus JB14]
MGKIKGSCCAVHSAADTGRFGTGLGSSGTSGARALAKKCEDAALQQTRATQASCAEHQMIRWREPNPVPNLPVPASVMYSRFKMYSEAYDPSMMCAVEGSDKKAS